MSILFSSKARAAVMKLFLYNSGDRYYQRQIAELTNQPIRAVQRETTKLLNIGLIMKHSEGNRIYYGVNKKCPIYNELRMIFIKTTGIAEYLKNEIAGDRINFAFIYGSYADNSENPSSDIDLFVVGDTSSMEISAVISKVKMDMAREINYVIMTLNELKDRLLSGENFVKAVISGKKIFVIGDENEFKSIIKSGKSRAS